MNIEDKKILLSLGLPIFLKKEDRKAVIELNENDCVVVNYQNYGSIYLHDFNADGWKIINPIKRLRYAIKKRFR